jgi:riboflavin synthase alpha subunit
MIKCVITIKEVPGKGYYVDVVPDQTKATPTEMRVAGCMNFAMDAVAKYLMSMGEKGQMIEGRDATIVEEIAKSKIKEFESGL